MGYNKVMHSKLIVTDRSFSQFFGLPLAAFLLASGLALLGSGCGPAPQGGSGDSANATAGAKSPAAAPKTAAEPFGTYALIDVDGKKVPCSITHEGQSMTIQSGSLLVNRDGTCVSKVAVAGEDAASETKATFQQEGSTLKMKWEGAGTTIGNLDGNTLKMSNEGMIFTYRK